MALEAELLRKVPSDGTWLNQARMPFYPPTLDGEHDVHGFTMDINMTLLLRDVHYPGFVHGSGGRCAEGLLVAGRFNRGFEVMVLLPLPLLLRANMTQRIVSSRCLAVLTRDGSLTTEAADCSRP